MRTNLVNSRLLWLAACVGLAAFTSNCTEPNPQFSDPSENNPCAAGELVIESFDVARPNLVDILFVIDNSPGMGDVQNDLSDALMEFVSDLSDIDGLDFHIGVISTDIVNSDHQGRLQNGLPDQPGCPGQRPLYVTSSTSSGPSVLACNAVLGETGDDYEAGLDAVRYAFLGPAGQPGAENEGFARADARLVVIFVSDEDDCSNEGSLSRQNPNECVWDQDQLVSLETYMASNGFYALIKGRSGQPVDVVAIVGPDDGIEYDQPEEPQPVCSGNGEAYAGRRYLAVVDAMGDRGGFHSICASRYESILDSIIDNHIVPRPEVICPMLHLSQEPASVRVIDITNAFDAVSIEESPNGYIYLGADDQCPTGRILLAPESHGAYGDAERIEVSYCTSDPVP